MEANSENELFENNDNIEPNPRPDWLLRSFVDMANEEKNIFNLGITLLTHGYLVSGLLISGREYFRGIGDQIASAIDNESGEKAQFVKEHFVKLGIETYDAIEKAKNPYPVNFIHLKDASFYHPDKTPLPSSGGVWWRGRLFEVSGFFLGKLEQQ